MKKIMIIVYTTFQLILIVILTVLSFWKFSYSERWKLETNTYEYFTDSSGEDRVRVKYPGYSGFIATLRARLRNV